MIDQKRIEAKFRAHCAAERELYAEHLAACETQIERAFIRSLYRARKAVSEAIGEAFIEIINDGEVSS